MSASSEISLINFYVVNTNLSYAEGEEEKKILYFWPPETDLDTQMKNVGLSEAIIKFTETFNPGKPCEALHTQKTRQLYHNPEKGFWIVMTINLPLVTRSASNSYSGGTTLVWGEEEVQDRVFLGVLRHAYRTFCLFSGSFTSLVEKGRSKVLNKGAGDVDDHYYLLRSRLDHFFSLYLNQSLRLNHADLLEVFQGVSFLPLDRRSFLRVRCFLSRAEEDVDWVLRKSGLNADETQVLYRYLVGSLLPAHLEGTELQGGSIPRHGRYPPSSSHYGRFVTGPSNLCDGAPIGKMPLVFVNPQVPKQNASEGKNNFGVLESEKSKNKEEPFHLLVYRALSATLCLLISDTYSLTLSDFREIDAALGPGLTSLASQVAEMIGGGLAPASPTTPSSAHSSPASSSSPASASPGFGPHLPPPIIHGSSGPRFLYFNRLNLAVKSSIHLDSRGVGNVAVTRDVLMMLADINTDLRGYPFNTYETERNDNHHDKSLQKRIQPSYKSVSAEIMLNTESDVWVVGKLSDQREFYVVLCQKNADLMTVNEEVKRLCDSQFKCIFFHE
ncbi:hypothetical protein J437_LFUL007036 [Ladona fulva]|uniref:CCZ1/INTU/HSP4 first Longin domain-containing protein n=1 Tax=Ladona fulva TaxID=123851 RepID=A0A8K0P0N4_LADFU|nr:hypothetical protein J437_LFUL007036 [Ladona fulva]